MKAILLAAGMGTRLRPLTDTIPKCLIPINKKPLLEIWIDLLKQHNITSILVNTHHHANTVDRFIQQTASNTLLKITSFYEKKLLGSGGTVFANQDFVADDKNFIIAYADNLTDINLSKMISFHNRCRSKGGILTMGLFRTPDPESCGIVTLDHNQRIIKFIEKPKYPESNLANGGIYIASTDIFDILSTIKLKIKFGVFDFGYHVLPALCGKMFGYEIKEYVKDIGTLESYYKAQDEWSKRGIT